MISNVSSQLAAMKGWISKAFSFIIKNWLIIGISITLGKGVVYFVGPRVNMDAHEYIVDLISPELKKSEERIFHRTDSIHTVQSSSIDTVLVNEIVNRVVDTVSISIKETSIKTFNNQMAKLKFDTVPIYDGETGKKNGYFIMMITPNGQPMLFKNKTSFNY